MTAFCGPKFLGEFHLLKICAHFDSSIAGKAQANGMHALFLLSGFWRGRVQFGGKRGVLSPSWRSALLCVGAAEWNARDGIAGRAF